MKHQSFLQQIIRMGGTLFFLTGCGTYGSTPTAALVTPTSVHTSLPATEITGPTISTIAVLPFTGSVVIEEGRCCIGSFEGDTIQARVDFSATSPFGKVTGMRVLESLGCSTNAKMEAADWEPFAPAKTFPIVVRINWVGFYISAQFQDEYGNLSPVYCDDISVEGSPRKPLVDPTDWYPQIQCFSENEVHPGPGETVTGTNTIFSWPNKNNLPEGVFYKVSVYGAGDSYTALVATGQTRDTSITLQTPRERLEDMVWYVTLVDANGTFLDHGQCSSFSASLLTVDPPSGIKGIHFWAQP